MRRSTLSLLKRLPLYAVLCGGLYGSACKKEEKPSAPPKANDILQKMNAREKALSSFSIQVRTEDLDVTIEHTLLFRLPNFIRAEVTQPQKVVLSFDGQNHYRLEEAEKKLLILNLQLPTIERRMALSMLMSAWVPEGFQLPRVVVRDSKPSWVEPGRTLRLENHLSEEGETARIAYVVRWPSLDFLKKEMAVDGQQQVEFSMQEEQCLPELGICVPTQILARQNEEALAPQKIKLLSWEVVSNERFVLEAPEGFAVERHNISSLQELAPFVR